MRGKGDKGHKEKEKGKSERERECRIFSSREE